LLTQALLTQALLTQALLTEALLAEALLTEALPTQHGGVLQLRLVLQHSDDLWHDRQELPQKHVNSKSALFQLRSCSDLHFYRPFRFDFTRELVSWTTLTWLGSQVRSLRWPPF